MLAGCALFCVGSLAFMASVAVQISLAARALDAWVRSPQLASFPWPERSAGVVGRLPCAHDVIVQTWCTSCMRRGCVFAGRNGETVSACLHNHISYRIRVFRLLPSGCRVWCWVCRMRSERGKTRHSGIMNLGRGLRFRCEQLGWACFVVGRICFLVAAHYPACGACRHAAAPAFPPLKTT